jgi:hypothetical protein
MNVIELRDKLNEVIEEGHSSLPVCFNSPYAISDVNGVWLETCEELGVFTAVMLDSGFRKKESGNGRKRTF